MKNLRWIFAALILVFSAGCTAIPEAGTRVYVYEKVRRVQTGNNPEQVHYLMDGPPSYVTSFRRGYETYEIWEYRVGNFLHAETVMILFKNSRVIALPPNSQALIGILNAEGVVQGAELWSQNAR